MLYLSTDEGSPALERKCSQCTYLNKIHTDVCEICESPLTSAISSSEAIDLTQDDDDVGETILIDDDVENEDYVDESSAELDLSDTATQHDMTLSQQDCQQIGILGTNTEDQLQVLELLGRRYGGRKKGKNTFCGNLL